MLNYYYYYYYLLFIIKIEAAEMRFLRPMAVYTLWDKKEVAT